METFNYNSEGKAIEFVILQDQTNKTFFKYNNGNGLDLVNEIISSQPLFSDRQVKANVVEYYLAPNNEIIGNTTNVSFVVEPNEYEVLAQLAMTEINQLKRLINGRLSNKFGHRIFADDDLRFLIPLEFTLSQESQVITVTVSQSQANETIQYSYDGGNTWVTTANSGTLSTGQHEVILRYENLPDTISKTKSILVE